MHGTMNIEFTFDSVDIRYTTVTSATLMHYNIEHDEDCI